MAPSDIILDGREWSKTFTAALYKMHEAQQLCDTLIALDDGESVLAHACVLAAASPTLKSKLVEQDTSSTIRHLDSFGMCPTIWKYLLQFMYTSHVVLSREQSHYLREIEDAALTLSIGSLIDAVALAKTRVFERRPSADDDTVVVVDANQTAADDSNQQGGHNETAAGEDTTEVKVKKEEAPKKRGRGRPRKQPRAPIVLSGDEADNTVPSEAVAPMDIATPASAALSGTVPTVRKSARKPKRKRFGYPVVTIDDDDATGDTTIAAEQMADTAADEAVSEFAVKQEPGSEGAQEDWTEDGDADYSPGGGGDEKRRRRSYGDGGGTPKKVRAGSAVCTICNGVFPGRNLLMRHIRTFHPDKTGHVCRACDGGEDVYFKHRYQLEDHNRKKHNAPPLVCEVCFEDFMTADTHRRHQRLYHPDYLAARERGEDVSSFVPELEVTSTTLTRVGGATEASASMVQVLLPEGMTEAEAAEAGLSQEVSHTPVVLGSFIEETTENSQLGEDEEEDTEGDTSMTEETVTLVEAKIQNSELRKCPLCEFEGSRLAMLRHRQMAHRSEDADRFPCRLCHKEFSTKASLCNHQTLRHPDKYRGDYKCRRCPKTFRMSGQLEDHMRMKHGAPPLICEKCQGEFRTRDSLYRHERFKHKVNHRKEVKVYCGECDIHFKATMFYENHCRKEHNAPPLVCEQCGEEFIMKEAFKRHMQLAHHDKKPVLIKALDKTGMSGVKIEELENAVVQSKEQLQEWNRYHAQFKCKECDYVGYNQHVLDQHMKKHSSKKEYKCETCGKEFKYKVGVINHQVKYHPETLKSSHRCQTCDQVFGRLGHLEDHAREEHGAPPLQCHLCEDTFITRDTLYRHQVKEHNVKRRMTKQLWKCDHADCKFVAPSESLLRTHQMSHTDARPFICEQCGQSFKYKGDLKRHTLEKHVPADQRPVKIFVCDTCGAKFNNKRKCERHQVSRHQKEYMRMFECEEPGCVREFGSRTLREDHVRMEHQGVLPMCHHCNVLLNSADEWFEHRRLHHPGDVLKTSSQLFLCGVCHKQFKMLGQLKRHENYHRTERPVKCDVCSATFVCKEDMKIHYKVHLGGRSFKCPQCDFVTMRKFSLQVHMKKHTNEMLQCPICEKLYQTGPGLRKHLLLTHKTSWKSAMGDAEINGQTVRVVSDDTAISLVHQQEAMMTEDDTTGLSGSEHIQLVEGADGETIMLVTDHRSAGVSHGQSAGVDVQYLLTGGGGEDDPGAGAAQHLIIQEPDDGGHTQFALHDGDEEMYVEQREEKGADLAAFPKLESAAAAGDAGPHVEGEEVVYMVQQAGGDNDADPSADPSVTSAGGQSVMYIKLGDQYVQVVDPAGIVQQ